MRNKKKNRTILLLMIVLLGISIAFAALATQLKITGTGKVNKNTWNVYWANVANEKGVSTTTPSIGNDENGGINTKVTWSVNLDLPGDYYEFTVDAVNAGTIDAMITNIENTVTPNLPNYIKYTVTYADGGKISKNQLLAKAGVNPTTEKYKVRVEFLDTITPEQLEAIPESGNTYTFTYEINYAQANKNAGDRVISLCRKATVLHTEVCEVNYICTENNNFGDIITFGNINSTNNLQAGDAYDCDVDGNGVYDKDERFYYLYDIDTDTSALIYYNNVKQGEADEVYTNAYDIDNDAYANGPKTARSELPTETQWPNVSLKSKLVNIYDNRGNLKLANFSYEGYAARLISVKDLDAACGSNFEIDPSSSGFGERGALDSCEFLMENTYYDEYYESSSDPNRTTNPGYWTDSPYQYTTTLAMFVSASGRRLGSPNVNSTTYGIRPVIEVPTAELKK